MAADDLDVDGCKRLACAVVKSALDQPRPHAVAWLTSHDGEWWLGAIGLQAGQVLAGLDRPRVRAEPDPDAEDF